MIQFSIRAALLLSFAFAPTTFALAQTVPDQYRVVPGQRLGRVFLGDSQKTVRRRLGAPAKTFKFANGFTSDLWRGSKRRDINRFNTLEVIYRRNVVVQIEATNPVFKTAQGLGLASSGEEWFDRYAEPQVTFLRFPKRGNVRLQYHDWKGAGIAQELRSTDVEPQPETLIVHRRNVAVVPDVGGVVAR